jgi:hypothetical protein
MINKKQQQALSVTIENNNNNKGIVTHAILCSLQGRETGEVAEEDVLVFLVPRQAWKAETEVQHKCGTHFSVMEHFRMNSSSAISVCIRRQCEHWNRETQYCKENSL